MYRWDRMPAQNTPLLAMEVELRTLTVADPLGTHTQ